MNPGFLSFILISITLILLASGWRRTLLGDAPVRAIAGFFVAWLAMGQIRFRLSEHATVAGAAIVLAVSVVVAAARRRSPLGLLHLVSLGLFLASVYYLLKHIGELNPFFWPNRSWSAAGLAVAAAAAMLVRRAEDQLAVVSMALLLGTFLYWRVHQQPAGAVFGNLRFQDEWWFAAACARTMSVAGESSLALARGASKTIAKRWRGLKK
ncbi:hypothetical protein [Paenibacillus sp. GYB003]|uniref:hypothetical protein n=1 Tax=Paenibacillus sp. GYB003 TaxID=2994392 RepID=UPI002F968993